MHWSKGGPRYLIASPVFLKTILRLLFPNSRMRVIGFLVKSMDLIFLVFILSPYAKLASQGAFSISCSDSANKTVTTTYRTVYNLSPCKTSPMCSPSKTSLNMPAEYMLSSNWNKALSSSSLDSKFSHVVAVQFHVRPLILMYIFNKSDIVDIYLMFFQYIK